MSKYSKFNLIYRLQKWMDSVAGQTFLNYAYSWGASVVILGTLFKLTHLPGANFFLFLGMGTEVFVFFISAFDRPFDKTADGRDMPTHMSEEFLASGQVTYTTAEQQAAAETAQAPETVHVSAQSLSSAPGQTVPSSWAAAPASVQSGMEASPATGTPNVSRQPEAKTAESVGNVHGAGQPVPQGGLQPTYVPQMSADEAAALNEAQGNYVDELKELVETLKKVNEQSSRLTRDSEEMENLNRTLTGISKVYEMQLKGASQQIGTIDQINDQSRKMAQQIEQLNQIYARMIEAMTVNMKAAAPLKKDE